MIIKTLRIRKENFGWIACNICDCNAYEISSETAKVISFLGDIPKEEFNKENLFNAFVSLENYDKMITKAMFEEIFEELKAQGWIDGKI